MSSPQCYRVGDTLPRIGNKLGEANVIKLQDSPNYRMDGKTKVYGESSLVKGHLEAMVSSTSSSGILICTLGEKE